MTSDDLNQFVDETVNRLRDRIVGIGDEQYSGGDVQKFETVHLATLFEMTHEELDDMIVYTCMLKLRLERIQKFYGRLTTEDLP